MAAEAISSANAMTSLVELHNLNELSSRLRANRDMSNIVIEGVDINPVASEIVRADVTGTVFLGCEMSNAISHVLLENGALLFPKLRGLPRSPIAPSCIRLRNCSTASTRLNPKLRCRRADLCPRGLNRQVCAIVVP
jgi:hypothetical protein